MLRVIMLIVIMLIVIMLIVIMLIVIMLAVIMLTVIMATGEAPQKPVPLSFSVENIFMVFYGTLCYNFRQCWIKTRQSQN
jgi:hypothetical protein